VAYEVPLLGGTPCPACAAAEGRPFHPVYHSDCGRCEIRSVSQAPRHLREAFYERIADDEERAAFKAAVTAEYQRRLALRQS